MKKLPIGLVERESGVAKDTLRVWERRYGFPIPHRDQNGDRCYDLDQVEKLKLIKRLLDRGHRPAKLVTMSAADLSGLLQDNSQEEEETDSTLAAQVIGLLQAADQAELVAVLTQKLASGGLMSFVADELAPMNGSIGRAWAQGRISVAQEHLYSEVIQKILRAYLLNLSAHQGRPRVLLATLPGEQHGLGLLMVESVITATGALPISLGTEVPLDEIAAAARSHRCDAAAISFSRARKPSFVTQGVKALREQLLPGQELWIGGEGAAWLRHPLDGVVHLPDLRSVQGRLLSWKRKDPA